MTPAELSGIDSAVFLFREDNMKNIFNTILAVCIALFALTGCHSSKPAMKTDSHEQYEKAKKNTYADLSKRLGVKVNAQDNIDLLEMCARWLGSPYKYGGSSRKGIDCSGFTLKVYSTVYNKKLERASASILSKNCRRIKQKELEQGDLVFFATGKNRKKVNHVGIYLKDNKFVHASTSRGVIVSSLKEPYYVRTFVTAGKVK